MISREYLRKIIEEEYEQYKKDLDEDIARNTNDESRRMTNGLVDFKRRLVSKFKMIWPLEMENLMPYIDIETGQYYIEDQSINVSINFCFKNIGAKCQQAINEK